MFNRTFLEKMQQILSAVVIQKEQVVCQLFMLWWLIDNCMYMCKCENGQARPLLYQNFLFKNYSKTNA